MESGRALYIEDADICVFACDAPEMQPLAVQLQVLCTLVLLGLQSLDFLRIAAGRNADIEAYMKQHIDFSRLHRHASRNQEKRGSQYYSSRELRDASESDARNGAATGHQLQQGEGVLGGRGLILAGDQLAVNDNFGRVRLNAGVERGSVLENFLWIVRDDKVASEHVLYCLSAS